MRVTILAALAAAMIEAGCAADSAIVERIMVMPSTYDPLTCPEVVAKHNAAEARMKELTVLMEKSGNPIANAIAYDTEYATARANRKFALEAAGRKGCDLAQKTPAPPPETKPPEAMRPDAGIRPDPRRPGG